VDTLTNMRIFTAVASELSFTAGAKRLGISTKVASKHVQQLESKLEAQLFHRTTRSVTLTDTGRAYFERCGPLLDQFDELEGLVQTRQSELSGPIRITAPTAFGSSHLVAALKPFQHQHPKVKIELQLTDKRIALIEEGFDLAIRFGELEDSTLIAKRLLTMRMVLFASPEYLQSYGQPHTVDEIAQHNCLIGNASIEREHWRFRLQQDLASVTVSGSFSANSPRAVAHMAAQGLGIGRAPLYVVEPFLRTKSLILLFEENEASELALNAVYPPSRHLTARIRALIDHLSHFFDHNTPESKQHPSHLL